MRGQGGIGSVMHVEKYSESGEEIPAPMDLLHLAISRRV